MENAVEEVKKRINIVEFIGGYITLKKAGRNFKAVCPFHQEKTPSFVISPERQIWHCFGACGDGGDAIKFLMKWDNITFIEALTDLANKTGVKLKNLNLEDKSWNQKERLLKINSLAGDFFQYVLSKTSFGQSARDYLSSRLINTQIIKKFGLGYAPNSWDSLLKFLKSKKYHEQEIVEAGLLINSSRGSFYDRFRGRLMFPLRDSRGNTIGFSGRILDGDKKEAKYVNTPETLIYHKRETLFGINLAKESIKKENMAILVEGEFDMISPYQYGIENIVAIKGSAVTKEQLTLIKRYTDRIALALDTDEAGIQAIKRGIEEAESMDFEIEVLSFDYAKDPDEAVHKDLAKFKSILKKPIPIYDFLIIEAQKKYPGNDPFSKKKISEEIVPYIMRIDNPIIQSHYLKKISQVLEIEESSIREFMYKLKNKIKRRASYVYKKNNNQDSSRELLIQKYVLSLIFQNQVWFHKIAPILKPDDFSIPSYEKILTFFIDFLEKNKDNFDINKFAQFLPQELKPVFDEIYLYSSSDLDFESQKIIKLSYEIKRYSLKSKIKKSLELETDTEETGQNLKKISEDLKEVEKRLSAL